jgi:hypothetical protein
METSPVAWYAAILSTAVLAWDLAKWWRSEPRLLSRKRPTALHAVRTSSLPARGVETPLVAAPKLIVLASRAC